MIISIEGIDGSGKTTMGEFLQDYLRGAHNIDAFLTSEFNFSGLAKTFKTELGACQTSKEEYEVVCRARDYHFAQVVRPVLKQGGTIIFDRYLHSTIAYQCYGSQRDLTEQDCVAQMIDNHKEKELPFPNLTVLLNTTPLRAAKRNATKSKDELIAIDEKDFEFFNRVNHGLRQASGYLGQYIEHQALVNANISEAEVRESVIRAFERFYVKYTKRKFIQRP